jgi:hypothetical protein
MILAISKSAYDLERSGDEAGRIAHHAIKLLGEGPSTSM